MQMVQVAGSVPYCVRPLTVNGAAVTPAKVQTATDDPTGFCVKNDITSEMAVNRACSHRVVFSSNGACIDPVRSSRMIR